MEKETGKEKNERRRNNQRMVKKIWLLCER